MRLVLFGAVLGAAVSICGALLFVSSDATAEPELSQCDCSKRCAREGSGSACLRECTCGDLHCATLVSEQGVAIACK